MQAEASTETHTEKHGLAAGDAGRPASADWAPASIAWGDAVAGPLKRRRKSPLLPLSMDTESALAGTAMGWASQRRPQ